MRLSRFLAPMLACLTVVGSLATTVRAQEPAKPVALVSIAPLNRTLNDTTYLLRACGVPEFGGIFSLMANTYTAGINRDKPIGAIVTLQGQMPSALIFMPMDDREQFFGALGSLAIEPDDLGDGLYEIDANGQTIYAKQSGDWMFISQTEDGFGDLPEDPSAMLGNLSERYDIAVRLNVQALPAEMKSMVTEQMRIGFENGMAEQAGQTSEEAAAAREVGEASIAQIEQFVSDTEQVVLGWAIDSAAQKTYMDGGVQFMEGSKLAVQADSAANLTSDYTSFILPGASAKFRFSSVIAEQDKMVAKSNVMNSKSQIEAQLAQSDMPPEAQELVQELVDGLIELTVQTIDEGTFDGAGSLSVTDNTLRGLMGGRIADGKALAQLFKDAAAKIPGGQAPIEFDYETYKGVTLHKAMIPVQASDPAVRQVLGEVLLVTIGTSDKGFLVALDPDGDQAVKAAIDRMPGSMGVKVSPFDAAIKMESIMQFAQSVMPNPILDNAIQAMASFSGKDKIEITGNVIPRGGIYRLSIEEGVLRSIGAAAKSGAAGGGGF